MIEKLIIQYINRMNLNDIDSFARKNGIVLNNDELELVFYHIKNNWRTIVYGNPKPILEDLRSKVDGLTYQKIENLYIEFKNKYSSYL
ncbi:MAG: DUF2624 family protein [Firmicutes bacterium]|nr:DUF2624 family protein [Bacillota bacterium]